MANRDINDLHPDLKPLCEEFLAQCNAIDLDVKITFTYRTPQEQDEIFAQGRTKPGRMVTNLRGKQSKHCYTIDGQPAAKAFDFGVFDNGAYIGNGSDDRYLEAGEIGESLGLRWGGRWKHPYDPGHLEIE